MKTLLYAVRDDDEAFEVCVDADGWVEVRNINRHDPEDVGVGLIPPEQLRSSALALLDAAGLSHQIEVRSPG